MYASATDGWALLCRQVPRRRGDRPKKKNDDSSSTKSMSEAQEKAMMDDIFMKVCTREACKGIDLETYMEIEKSETGIKTSGIERTGQFADQDEL